MGLGFHDGFPPLEIEMWEHWCPAYDGYIGMEKNEPCNWCGKHEHDLEDGNE